MWARATRPRSLFFRVPVLGPSLLFGTPSPHASKILKTIEFYKTGVQNLDSKELRSQNLQNKGVSFGQRSVGATSVVPMVG